MDMTCVSLSSLLFSSLRPVLPNSKLMSVLRFLQSNKLVQELPYDIMAIGNHELYDYDIAYDMYTNFAPKLGDKYLSSNVNITVADSTGATVSVPVGRKFRFYFIVRTRVSRADGN